MAIQIDTVYRQYGPMVLRRCRQLLRDDAAAADAMHDVFVEVLRRQEQLDDRAPSSLLFRIATNVCLNKIRTRRRRPETRDEELLATLADADDLQSAATARSVLGRLFGREQESTGVIAVLHWVDGMTLEEVAAEVGMSVSGVRKRLRRVRDLLTGLEEAAA